MIEDEAARPVETELKLAVPPGQGARLLGHPAFRAALAAPPQERHEVTTYFDTPDFALAREGLSPRVRRSGGRRVQTMEAGGAADGVALRRGGWEWPIEQDEPDLGPLARTPLDGVALGRVEGRLGPVFVTDIRRNACALRLDGGTEVEAVLDEGGIAAGDAREPVNELERELKAGPPGPLYRLALDPHAAVPLLVLAESKTPAARKSADLHLPGGASVAEAVRRVVEACLGGFVADRVPRSVATPRACIKRASRYDGCAPPWCCSTRA